MKTETLSLLTTTGAILRLTRSKRLVTLPLILRNPRSSSLVQPETPLRSSEAKIEALASLLSKFTICHYSFSPAAMFHRFALPAGHVRPRALPIALMIGPAKIYFIVFGILTIAGGIVGYVKAGSTVSIIAGSISGVLLLLAAWLMPEHRAAGLVVALVVSLLLAAQFIPKFFRTFKVMPAGLMSVLSAIGIIVAIAAWLRK